MAHKKKTVAEVGTSGGAAAAAGVGFQQQIAAYALAHVLVGDTALGTFGLDREFNFRSLHMETAQAIDDVVIIGHSHRALIQAKTKVSLSDAEKSAYGDALRQFVAHHVRDGRDGDAYVLAVGTKVSRNIRVDLTRLTELTRLNARALEENPRTGAEDEVLEKTRTLITLFLSKEGIASPTEEEFVAIFRRIYVLPLDFEGPRGRDEASALLLLRAKASIDSALVWAALLKLSSTLAIERGSIDKAGLFARAGHYLRPEGKPEKTLLGEMLLEVLTPLDPSVGKDVVMFAAPGHENKALVVTASERFHDDGSLTTIFTREGFKHADGGLQPIVCRSATLDGTLRYVRDNPHVQEGRKILIDQNRLAQNFESSVWAKAHKQFLRGLFDEKRQDLSCIVCGNPVSEDGAYVVEVEEEGASPAAGIAHRRCPYPGLRMIGEVKSPLFAHYKGLHDFDFNRWIAAAQKGSSILTTSVVQGTAVVLWNSQPPGHPRGGWCVRIDASDGSSHYVRHRAKVLRFAQESASTEAIDCQRTFDEAAATGDPYCVSEDRTLFARRSLLTRTLPRGTKLLQCTNASAVAFDVGIDKAYSSPTPYYAPVTLLVTPERGDAADVGGNVVMLSNPLNLLVFLENWQQASLDVPSIAADVIDTDEIFDRVVGQALSIGKTVLVDPLFDKNGTLVSGLEMRLNQ